MKRIFFGWWVAIACFFISTYVSGVIVHGFTTIIQPLIAEYGWSYTEISFAVSLQSLVLGISAPLIGLMVDRWQPSRVILTGVFINLVSLFLLSNISSLPMFYAAYMLLSVGFGFTLGTPLMTIVVKWFRQNVAIAAGIVASGFAMGGIMITPITLLVDSLGWHLAMAVLGIGMLIIPLPLALLIQRKPYETGTTGNSKTLPASNPLVDKIAAKPMKGLDEIARVLKNRPFWHISLALTLQFIVINGVIIHIMPYLSGIGFSRPDAGLIASSMTVSGICGRLGFGWLGDKYNIAKLTLATLSILTAGIFFYCFASGAWAWLLAPFIILFGIGWGGQVSMTTALLNEQFGREKFGTVFGIYFSIMELGGMAGPVLAGWIIDTMHSYQPAWYLYTGMAFAAVIILATAPLASTLKGKGNIERE